MILRTWRAEPRLADAIERERAAIVSAEVARLGSGTPRYREQSSDVRAEWAADALDVVAAAIRSGHGEAFPRYTEHMRRVRLALGFTVSEVVAALLGLRDTLQQRLPPDDEHDAWHRTIDVVTTQLVAAVAGAFGEAMLQEATAETRSLQRVTSALLGKVTLAEMLELVCAEACAAAGARGSAVCLLEFETFSRQVVATGDVSGAPASLVTVVRRVLASEPPMQALVTTGPDLMRRYGDPGLPIETMLLVPLRIRGQSFGALVVVNKPDGFHGPDVHAIEQLAAQAAVAIDHARLHERHEQLAILEERQRLGRDLHDSVSQSLYGVIMYAAAASRLLATGQVAPAARHLEELQASALDALREMRLLLFDLRPSALVREGLSGALRARLASVESRSGIATTLEDLLDSPLPRVVEEGMYGVAQEALNNALKHARATRVAVRLVRSGDAVLLEIADNGCGFDVEATESRGGFGLRGMRERAAFLSGELEITASAGGTTVRLRVPWVDENVHPPQEAVTP